MPHFATAHGVRLGLPKFQQGILEVYTTRSSMEDTLHGALDLHTTRQARLSKKELKLTLDSYHEAHYAVCDLRLLADVVFQFSKALDMLLARHKLGLVGTDGSFGDVDLEKDLAKLWNHWPLAKALLTWVALQETSMLGRRALLELLTVTNLENNSPLLAEALEEVDWYNWGVLVASHAIRPASQSRQNSKSAAIQNTEMDITNHFLAGIKSIKSQNVVITTA